jgi:hypothetical protein
MESNDAKRPYISAHLHFPARVTGLFRFDRDIAVTMGPSLWFYCPFSHHRQQTQGLVHHEYQHSNPISCVALIRMPASYAVSSVPDAYDPSSATEANLLILDSQSTFFLLNLARGFVCARFEVPDITTPSVTELRGSLVREGEFVSVTPTQVLICQIDLAGHRRAIRILHRHDICAQSVHEFSNGYLALHNHNLLFLGGAVCDDYFPRKLVNQFAVDGNAVVTASLAHKSEVDVAVVNGPAFRVAKLMTLDAADERIVMLLKTKVMLVVDRTDVSHRMHIQLKWLHGSRLAK